jgi:hypothetical protein
MEVGLRLLSLGFEEYEAVFRENADDADVLRDLTDQEPGQAPLTDARAFLYP